MAADILGHVLLYYIVLSMCTLLGLLGIFIGKSATLVCPKVSRMFHEELKRNSFIRSVSMSELAGLPISPRVHLAVCCQHQVVLAGGVGCQLDNVLVSQVLNKFQELKFKMQSGHKTLLHSFLMTDLFMK